MKIGSSLPSLFVKICVYIVVIIFVKNYVIFRNLFLSYLSFKTMGFSCHSLNLEKMITVSSNFTNPNKETLGLDHKIILFFTNNSRPNLVNNI